MCRSRLHIQAFFVLEQRLHCGPEQPSSVGAPAQLIKLCREHTSRQQTSDEEEEVGARKGLPEVAKAPGWAWKHSDRILVKALERQQRICGM